VKPGAAILLFIGALLTPAGYGATFLLTDYFRQYGGNETDTGRLLGYAVVGTLLGVPAVGWTAQRLGGARLAAIGAAILCAGDLLLVAMANSRGGQPLSGFLLGLGWGMYYVAGPLCLMERTTSENRQFWFNRFGAFQITGTGLSPAIASYMSSYAHAPIAGIITAMALCSAGASLAYLRFDHANPQLVALDRQLAQGKNWLKAIGEISSTPAIYAIVMVFFGASIFSCMMTFQGSLVEVYGMNKGVYFIVYATVVSLSRFTLAPVIKRWEADRLSIALVLLMIAGVAAMFLVGFGAAYQVASAAALGLGSGLLFTTLQTQVVDSSDGKNQAHALTWFVLAHFCGLFGLPVLGGWLIANHGRTAFLCMVLLLAVCDLGVAARRYRRASTR
jgi:MFS family permease